MKKLLTVLSVILIIACAKENKTPEKQEEAEPDVVTVGKDRPNVQADIDNKGLYSEEFLQSFSELQSGIPMILKDNYILVETAYQRTAFLLDEKGAEIESEADMTVTTEVEAEVEDKPKPKNLVFDKPFLIILKRTDSPNPYFAAWIENTELMQKE